MHFDAPAINKKHLDEKNYGFVNLWIDVKYEQGKQELPKNL